VGIMANLIVSDIKTGRHQPLCLAMPVEPRADVRRYVQRNYPQFTIVMFCADIVLDLGEFAA
jgi:hypothetical protein